MKKQEPRILSAEEWNANSPFYCSKKACHSRASGNPGTFCATRNTSLRSSAYAKAPADMESHQTRRSFSEGGLRNLCVLCAEFFYSPIPKLGSRLRGNDTLRVARTIC
jgi:hypothetical protein